MALALGLVRVTLNPACSASFFSQNSVFLSQHFSQNSVFQPSFSKPFSAKFQQANFSQVSANFDMRIDLKVMQ